MCTLADQAQYLNHLYLACLISFLLIFMPAHRIWSVDAWLRPAIHRDTAAAWTLWLLRTQIGVVYVYAAFAKMNPDWLRGFPLWSWLDADADNPILGPLLRTEFGICSFAYGGLLFDLLVVPALLLRPTRVPAYLAACVFHLINACLFDIGIFPWMMIATTLIVFDPDWPRRFPILFAPRDRSQDPTAAEMPPLSAKDRLTLTLVGLYVAFQLLFPLRHLLYEGNVHWTEEGHRFAWHMKLRGKDAVPTVFTVTDPVGSQSWRVWPHKFLYHRQVRKMSARPDMILQFAHHLAEHYRNEGYERVEVRAKATVSLNSRPVQLMIDPDVDLAAQPRNLLKAHWILELTGQLPDHCEAWSWCDD